jgi:DNA replication protein DnaC
VIWEIPKRFIPARPNSISSDLLEKIRLWIPSTDTLLFFGATGRGKSWAAAIAARLWEQHQKDERRKREEADGPGFGFSHDAERCVWADVPSLAGALRDFDQSEDTVEWCQRAGLLVLDDLGAEKGSDFLLERVYAIVNHRYSWERPTIVTTNLDLEQMGALWPRMASRLCSGVVVSLAGKDKRLDS